MTISPFYSNRVIRRQETIAQIAQVPGRNWLIKVSGSPLRSQNRLQRRDVRLQLCLLNLINLGSAQGEKQIHGCLFKWDVYGYVRYVYP